MALMVYAPSVPWRGHRHHEPGIFPQRAGKGCDASSPLRPSVHRRRAVPAVGPAPPRPRRHRLERLSVGFRWCRARPQPGTSRSP